MKKLQKYLRGLMFAGILAMFALFAVGCRVGAGSEETAVSSDHDEDEHAEHEGEQADHEDEHEDEHAEHEDEHDHKAEAGMLILPELSAAELGGESLKVVASTSIIGDVVAQVGGEAIDLTVMIGPGQDPHSYEPAARDLTAVSNAHVIFMNGWDYDEVFEE